MRYLLAQNPYKGKIKEFSSKIAFKKLAHH